MREKKQKTRIILMYTVLVPALLVAFYFLTLTPRPWQGVDEAVVERIAREHGREAKPPLINTGQGDILLFVFLAAGVVGGFAAGYCWRMLASEKRNKEGS